MPLRPLEVSTPLCHLPLRPSTLLKFQQRGFTNTFELEKCRRKGGISNLATELGVTLLEASGYMREVQGCLSMDSSPSAESDNHMSQDSLLTTTRTATQILSANISGRSRIRCIVTFCRSIDRMLGGGITLGEVCEISGPPGIGKSQLAMQLCCDVAIPDSHGGAKGEAVFVDTEGNFSPERCMRMASELVEHIKRGHRHPRPAVPESFNAEQILRGIHVFRAHDEAAQTAIIAELPNFLEAQREQGRNIKLIVVDSIAFHYRSSPPGENFMARTRSLSNTAILLAEMAKTFDAAVVCLNQMTTKIDEGLGGSQLVPALGESWAHATTTRIALSWKKDDSNINNTGDTRQCTLIKSPLLPYGKAAYRVTNVGIRDADNSRRRHSGARDVLKRMTN